ncbi:hypothetical protein FQN49_002614 [Arthroderma sp. PD_2]|nr:hypothetical protein FQN49_002614 [Arthroderma sp. PD_2]
MEFRGPMVMPSLYGSLSSEPTSSENGSNDYAVSLHPNPAPLNMRFPATSAQPTDAAELHQTPIENSVSNHMLDQIDMRLFPLDLNLSAANPNSYTSKDYTEDSYSRLYQIYRLHTRIQELVSPFSAETHLPSANAPSFSREPSLADILSAADDLVQLTDDMVRPGNSFAGDVFQPGIPQYPLQPGLGPALPSDTISSTDPTSFPIILSCYANLLQIYEAVTSELFVLARNQSLTTIQMLQPHNHQPGATLYPSQMPNIRLGRLTLLSDAEPNVNFLVSLVSQSIERLRNAVWYYSTVPRPVYPHQPSRHLTGDPSIPLMETIPHDIQSREQNILALLHATKAMQSG